MNTALKPLPHDRQPVSGAVQPEVCEDAFLTLADLNPVRHDAARRTCKRALFEKEVTGSCMEWSEFAGLFP